MREDGSAFIFALHKEKAGWRFAGWTRRAILERLSSGVKSVTELAEPFRMSQPSISKHLKVLENAGLVVRGRDAQWRPRAVDAAPLAGANAYFEKFRKLWEERLDPGARRCARRTA